MSFIKELWNFMRVRKKFWLLPILLMMALFGALIVMSQGSAVAPFIYTLFQKMTAILGISAFYHDSAAALIIDGEPIVCTPKDAFSALWVLNQIYQQLAAAYIEKSSKTSH